MIRSLLSARLDGALAETDGAEVREHLSRCTSCRARLEALRAIKHAVARLPDREEPPGMIRARIERLQLPARRRWGAGWLGIAAAAILAIAGAAGISVAPPGPAKRAGELVADHLKSVPEVRPAEVSSGDPVTVARFFAEHVSFPAVVPSFPGATLLGGRLCSFDGRRVELLFYRLYRQDGRTLSLYVADQPLMPEGCTGSRGHHVCTRSHEDLVLVLVGELPAKQLQQLLASASFDRAS